MGGGGRGWQLTALLLQGICAVELIALITQLQLINFELCPALIASRAESAFNSSLSLSLSLSVAFSVSLCGPLRLC